MYVSNVKKISSGTLNGKYTKALTLEINSVCVSNVRKVSLGIVNAK